jgi:aerobic C4-dicarboxylate transport protein
MGEAMAVTNLIGNGVATIVVAKWCGEVDDDISDFRFQIDLGI